MTGKHRMLKTLRFEEPDRPPHFEIMFEVEKEAFGLAFPDRNGWHGCSRADQDRMIGQCMTIYERIVDLTVVRLSESRGHDSESRATVVAASPR